MIERDGNNLASARTRQIDHDLEYRQTSPSGVYYLSLSLYLPTISSKNTFYNRAEAEIFPLILMHYSSVRRSIEPFKNILLALTYCTHIPEAIQGLPRDLLCGKTNLEGTHD